MAKIAFIGAGSTVFARNLLQDLFTFPDLHGSTIALMDIDPGRLADTEAVAKLLAQSARANPTIEASPALDEVLSTGVVEDALTGERFDVPTGGELTLRMPAHSAQVLVPSSEAAS